MSDPLLKTFLSAELDPNGDEPVPQSALVNGNGQKSCTGLACKYEVIRAAVPVGNCTHPTTRVSCMYRPIDLASDDNAWAGQEICIVG